MGVSSTANRKTYNGDGTTTTFSFPYYFFNQTDLNVYLWDTAAGVVSPQTLNSNYTISGSQNAQGLYTSGGTLTFTTAPPSTSIVVIIRNPPQVQNYALLQNGNISSAAIVQQFDYLTLLIQRMQDQISRCVAIPDGVGGAYNPLLPNNTPITVNNNAYVQQNAGSTGLGFSVNPPVFNPVTQISVPYTSFQTANTSKQVTLFSLPAGAMLNYLAIKHSTAFAGAAITDVYAQLGIAATPGLFISQFDVLQAVGDQVFDQAVPTYIGSWANATNIIVNAVSTGANLSALTQGNINIFYSYVIL